MYKYGYIGPTTREVMIEDTKPRGVGPGIHSEPLLPPDVVRVGTGIGIRDYTPEGVEEVQGHHDQERNRGGTLDEPRPHPDLGVAPALGGRPLAA